MYVKHIHISCLRRNNTEHTLLHASVLLLVNILDSDAGLYITYPHDKRNAKKVGLSETLLEGALLK